MKKEIISAIASGASILSLAFLPELPQLARFLIGILGIACIIFLIKLAFSEKQINETVCHTNEEIRQKMKDIIKIQGKICILSRDLSWIDDDILGVLAGKRDSVLVFAEVENEITRKLVKVGVRVKYYGDTGFTPVTRFTVIRYNRDDRQVAIANTRNTIHSRSNFITHTIYMTSGLHEDRKDRWLNSLAFDMIMLFEKVSKEANNGEES